MKRSPQWVGIVWGFSFSVFKMYFNETFFKTQRKKNLSYSAAPQLKQLKQYRCINRQNWGIDEKSVTESYGETKGLSTPNFIISYFMWTAFWNWTRYSTAVARFVLSTLLISKYHCDASSWSTLTKKMIKPKSGRAAWLLWFIYLFIFMWTYYHRPILTEYTTRSKGKKT